MRFGTYSLGICILSILCMVQGLAANPPVFNATIWDNSGVSHNIKDVSLLWSLDRQWERYSSLAINVGAGAIDVSFNKIKSAEFNWSARQPTLKITSPDGELISGTRNNNPDNNNKELDNDHLQFMGETSFGEFTLPIRNTTKIEFNASSTK